MAVGNEYRDRIAAYLQHNYASHGLLVYTEVSLGKTIIGKRRRVDVFLRHASTNVAMALECKYQSLPGTTDEKIPYALMDLDALWIPGCLVYAGQGWSPGVLHTLEGARNAVYCEPRSDCARSQDTEELDHVVAAVFLLWDRVIPEHRRFDEKRQLELPAAPIQRAAEVTEARRRKHR